jgi:hypothetical protein
MFITESFVETEECERGECGLNMVLLVLTNAVQAKVDVYLILCAHTVDLNLNICAKTDHSLQGCDPPLLWDCKIDQVAG